MTYRVRRLNPYWHDHPMVPVGAAVGIICAGMGFLAGKPSVGAVGVVAAALAILSGARPIFSLLFCLIGLFGGISTFVIAPGLNAASLSWPLKILSIAMFTLFYTALMDAMLLVVAVVYNFLAGPGGLKGLEVDFGESDGGEAEG